MQRNRHDLGVIKVMSVTLHQLHHYQYNVTTKAACALGTGSCLGCADCNTYLAPWANPKAGLLHCCML